MSSTDRSDFPRRLPVGSQRTTRSTRWPGESAQFADPRHEPDLLHHAFPAVLFGKLVGRGAIALFDELLGELALIFAVVRHDDHPSRQRPRLTSSQSGDAPMHRPRGMPQISCQTSKPFKIKDLAMTYRKGCKAGRHSAGGGGRRICGRCRKRRRAIEPATAVSSPFLLFWPRRRGRIAASRAWKSTGRSVCRRPGYRSCAET